MGKSLQFTGPQSLSFFMGITNSASFTNFLELYKGPDAKYHLTVSFFNSFVHSSYYLFISVPGTVLKAGDPMVNKNSHGTCTYRAYGPDRRQA